MKEPAYQAQNEIDETLKAGCLEMVIFFLFLVIAFLVVVLNS